MQKINGRQRQGCGPGMPGPYGVALFVRRGGFRIRPQGWRRRKVYGLPCRGRRPRRPAERSRPLPTMRKINGRQRQGCGPGMPGPYGVALFVRRGGFRIRPQGWRRRKVYGLPCRGRRPRRPAERSRPLPTMRKINGRQRQGCGPGMPGPYGVALFVRRGGFRIRPQGWRRRKVYGLPCRGRRPRRPAERSRPLPTMRKINGRQRQGCGPGMPGPYGVAAVQAAREG